jgi:hypothetical protein
MSEEQRSACSSPEHRQFDFWLGEWEVRTPRGDVAGRNTIQRVVGGCGLREDWRGARGMIGTSLNTYSEARGEWHQTWIDSSGTLLLLDGGIQDGAMVLEGEAPLGGGHGASLRHRITWSVVDGDPDHVRQHWETSDDGSSWETAFDGHYHRLPESADAPAG